MCVLSIKVPIRKMSGNLFNDPRVWGGGYIYIYIRFHELINIINTNQLFIQKSDQKHGKFP